MDDHLSDEYLNQVQNQSDSFMKVNQSSGGQGYLKLDGHMTPVHLMLSNSSTSFSDQQPTCLHITSASTFSRWFKLRDSGGFPDDQDFCDFLLDNEDRRQRRSLDQGCSDEEYEDDRGQVEVKVEILEGETSEAKDKLKTERKTIIDLDSQNLDRAQPAASTVDLIGDANSLTSIVIGNPVPASNVMVKKLDSYACRRCDFTFSARDSLDEHMRQIHGLIPITRVDPPGKAVVIAPKQAEKENNLREEKTMAVSPAKRTDVKLYPCRKCGDKFNKQGALTRHDKIAHLGLKEHKCEQCEKAFFTLSGFREHRKVHSGAVAIPCPKCSGKYYSQTALEKHIRVIHDRKAGLPSYKCMLCKHLFLTKSDLGCHLKTSELCKEAKVQRNICSICGKVFKTQSSFREHQAWHDGGESYPCTLCQRVYYTEPRLTLHMRQAHTAVPSKTEPGVHLCSICGASFRSKYSMKEHLQIHANEMKCVCTVCGKIFNRNRSLRAHIRKYHEGEAPRFTCDVCKDSFSTAGTLEGHMNKIHHKVKPYSCEHCGEAFYAKDQLHRHIKLAHDQTSAQKFNCDLCDKAFPTTGMREHHRNQIHMKVKPYTCDQCSSCFYAKTNLTGHVRKVHNYGKQCTKTCEFCGETFRHKNTYDHHVNSVHRKKAAFPCKQCGSVFYTKLNLTTHMKNIHSTAAVRKWNKCRRCGLRFASLKDLNAHEVEELQAKYWAKHGGRLSLYFCKFCGKPFTKPAGAKRHEMGHSGIKSFKCHLCEQAFVYKPSLKNHVQQIHKGGIPKNFACDTCDKRFQKKDSWRDHMRKHHSDLPQPMEVMSDMQRVIEMPPIRDFSMSRPSGALN